MLETLFHDNLEIRFWPKKFFFSYLFMVERHTQAVEKENGTQRLFSPDLPTFINITYKNRRHVDSVNVLDSK